MLIIHHMVILFNRDVKDSTKADNHSIVYICFLGLRVNNRQGFSPCHCTSAGLNRNKPDNGQNSTMLPDL